MSNNSSNNNDNVSSSNYYDACSNSLELNEYVNKNKNNKKSEKSSEKSSEKNSFMKEDTISNYESPPKKSSNNINNYTNNSTQIFSSNRASNLNNLMISNKESLNKEDEKIVHKNSRNKININTMNSVKKKILTPIDEKINNKNIEGSKGELTTINDDDDNEDKNENNNNININIIINKKKKQKIENKFIYNNTNINNIKYMNKNKNNNDNLNNYKNEIINISKDKQSESSIYSSLDEIPSSTFQMKKTNKIQEIDNDDEEEESNNYNNYNTKKNVYSFLESNIGKKTIFDNSLSESIINKDYYKKLQLSKDNTVIFQDYMSLFINSITFEDIPQDHLTVNDLKTKYSLREIPVKRNNIPEKKRFLKTLLELQIFTFGDCPIWCLKISKNGKFLAAGNKIGKIRIYEIMGYDYEKYEKNYNSQTLKNFLYFIEEKPIKELYGHKKDITDLAWSPFRNELLLSSSVDHFVILWDISKENNCVVEKFDHKDLVTSIQFSPINENIFITGCFDKYVRIYNISKYINTIYNNMEDNVDIEINLEKTKKKNLKESISNAYGTKEKDFFNLTDKITVVSFFPEGNQIAIGTINGKINVYDFYDQKIRYNFYFTCRNRVGKNSLGKKITSINFINKSQAMITTCDSCIRLFSMNDGKKISKYRGYTNEKSMIRASIDLSNDIILSGSENGFCYAWHFKNEDKKIKNYNYEYFQPFCRDIVECSIIIDEKCYVNYIKKVLKLTNKINVISVIINSSDKGKIEVLLNIDEDTQ